MILSHFTALVTFALIVSTVFGLIHQPVDDEGRPTYDPVKQFRYGVFVFVSFLAVAFVVGWVMYPLPL